MQIGDSMLKSVINKQALSTLWFVDDISDSDLDNMIKSSLNSVVVLHCIHKCNISPLPQTVVLSWQLVSLYHVLVCCCGSPRCHSAGNIFENNSMQKYGHHSGERQASNTSLPLVLLAANEHSFSVPLVILVVLSASCVQNTYQIKCQINSP